MEKIIDRLKKKGVVLTPQRLAVADFLRGNTVHPTVDEVYHQLKIRYPTISQATVYASLEVLKQAGEIQELTIRREKACFDPNPKPHHHFFCRECKRVLNIEISCPVAQRGHIDGHRVKEVQAYFYGVCANCLKKKRRDS
ncbi:transcriptional repressor [candidate division NPL-UPA2 bacterium]|nr:transcriptional repressor [candidate division NPL-UPA2 bacterium]